MTSYDELNALMRERLIEIVRQHGGRYEFINYEDDDPNLDNCPMVLVNEIYYDGVQWCRVTSVDATKSGELRVYGTSENTVCFDPEYDEMELEVVPTYFVNIVELCTT